MKNSNIFQKPINILLNHNSPAGDLHLLNQLLLLEKALTVTASQTVVFQPPIISFQETGIIKKGTINIIQGKFGSHKSRLGELLCSLLLSTMDCTTDFLGFVKNSSESFLTVYVDTERNLTEEFPLAIQNIRSKAGYSTTESIPDFRFSSLKSTDRESRLDALKAYIEYIHTQTDKHILIFLDVLTDCSSDFNNSKESLLLFDFLGKICDTYGTTFMLIVHENPNSEKSRGHVGTEGTNKSSCVIQIGYENSNLDQESELLKIKFIKVRAAQKPKPFYVQYCNQVNGLVLNTDVSQVSLSKKPKRKAELCELIDALETIMVQPISRADLLNDLKAKFKCGERTIEDRLKQIIDTQREVYNYEGKPCYLKKSDMNGAAVYFWLAEIPTLNKDENDCPF